MLNQHDAEGFGGCTNIGECAAVCPKSVPLEVISRLNRDLGHALWKASTPTDPPASLHTEPGTSRVVLQTFCRGSRKVLGSVVFYVRTFYQRTPVGTFCACGGILCRTGACCAYGDRIAVPGGVEWPRPERHAPGRVQCPRP